MRSDPVPQLLANVTERLLKEFSHLPQEPPPAPDAQARPRRSARERTAERLSDNYPYFHPLYAGQMLKPPHPVARAAYALAMLINPNNHARDGGRASSAMEIEQSARLPPCSAGGMSTWATSPPAEPLPTWRRCG